MIKPLVETHKKPSRRDGALAVLLASPALSRLVTHFVIQPRADLHFQALKRATALPNRSLQLELVRLERLRMITRRQDGRLVRYCVRQEESRWKPLREVVREFAEPSDVLRTALTQVAGITAAFVYGSFARRVATHEGSDVDLFVVASSFDAPAERLPLAEAVLEVSGFIGREVNVTRHTPKQLATKLAAGARFLTSVLSGEKEWLIGDQMRLSDAIAAASPISPIGMPG